MYIVNEKKEIYILYVTYVYTKLYVTKYILQVLREKQDLLISDPNCAIFLIYTLLFIGTSGTTQKHSYIMFHFFFSQLT